MICKNPKCKKSLSEDFRYCPYCGLRISTEYQANTLSTFLPSDYTLGMIYKLWSREHFPNLGLKTKKGYIAAWKRVSCFEQEKMTDLKTMHYQVIINSMIEDELSRSTIEKVRGLIAQLCKYALKNDIIQKNYAEFLTLPKTQKNGRNRFSDEELKVLWEHSDDIAVRRILIFAYTGMRANELFQMKKENVFLDGLIPYMIGGNKTEAGIERTIAIAPCIFEFVKQEYMHGKVYLIEGEMRNSLDLDNWRNRNYRPTLQRLGITYRPIHSLRHTFASMMVKANANPKALAALMGHTQFSTTADLYAHADLQQLGDAVKLLKVIESD